MTYIIYKDGEIINRIVADEAFCEQYYSIGGYSWELEPPPDPEPEPGPEKTDMDLMADAYREGVDDA